MIFVLPWLMGATGCPNGLSEFADKKTDAAYLFQAQMYADKSDWTNAIAQIGLMTATGQAKADTKAALASYYAGRCGLDLLTLADAINNGISSKTLWTILLSTYKAGTSTNLTDCKTAETTMRSISSTFSGLTSDQNVELAFIEFAKMGVVMASAAKLDANHDGTIDGSLDAGTGTFDACDSTHITDALVGELGTGLTIAMSALSASGGSIASSVTTSYNTLCSTLATYGYSSLCTTYTSSGFSSTDLLALRALIKSNEIGFNTCSGSFGQNSTGRGNDCTCPTTP